MPKKYILMAIFFSIAFSARPQIGKRILNRAKSDAEYKVNQKINQKVDKTVNKAIDETDTLITGKKKQTQKNEQQKEDIAPAGSQYKSSDKFAEQMNTELSSNVIFTDLNCEQGKRNIEKRFKVLKGIKSFTANPQNGQISISYDEREISYSKIISELNNLGFEADANPPPKGKKGCN